MPTGVKVLKSRLFYKIFFSYVLIIFLAVVVMGLMFARQVKGKLIEEIKIDLIGNARIIAFLSKSEIERRLSSLADISCSRVTLVGATGWVLADSEKNVAEMDNHLNRPEIQEARIKGQGDAIRYSHTLGVDMLYIAFPIKEGTELKGYIRLARPLFEVKKSLDQLYNQVYKIILVAIMSSLLIALLFSKKLVSPILKTESFTRKICNGELPGTLLMESNDEIGRLAKNINCMVLEHQEKIRSAQEEKSKLESAFASMTEGVLVLNSQNRIEFLNKGLRDILGRQYITDIINKTPLEAFLNAELEDALDRFRETRTPVSREITLGDDNPIIMDVTISPIYGPSGAEEKTMMVFHDVTRLKKLEKIREDFVANVTHEIKTPLTAIIGFIETLQGGAINEKENAGKFLQIISENARRLDRLVDDLLTLSNIELGEMKLRLEAVSLGAIVEDTLHVFETKAAEKSLTIDKGIPEGLPLILGDRDRVSQILLNILDNAVKFTLDGGRISITASDDGRGSVVVKVIDTGIGIPKSEIPRLGERFYRVDKTRSRERGGTG
ncbi:MAG TPA: histidine kinase dimerization/phospho-acceptor domain-containing protein, partial [Syntrophales bacterium]|nr:histidine kinase dimerization/phospho-acceptor domain-containing protein [Syntrophales bacterium]